MLVRIYNIFVRKDKHLCLANEVELYIAHTVHDRVFFLLVM